LPGVEGGKPSREKFKAYPIGYFHVDIAEVQTAEGKLCLYGKLIAYGCRGLRGQRGRNRAQLAARLVR
jgi:hypothetical protein